MLTQSLCSKRKLISGALGPLYHLRWTSLTVVNGFQPFTIIIKTSILDIAAVLNPPLLIIYLLLKVNHCRNPSILQFLFAQLFRKKKYFKTKNFFKNLKLLYLNKYFQKSYGKNELKNQTVKCMRATAFLKITILQESTSCNITQNF